ncbi:MAG TPA: hypothetical protein VGP41_07475 [Candidatus Lustribacter sp.]|nr:hypothetical protein [Candidatus Lustribacter sp.]
MKSFGKHLQRLGAGAALTGLVFTGSPGFATAQVWYGGPPPPPPRYEPHPDRPGYVWRTGHWYRTGDRWAWSAGPYIVVNPGRHWVDGHWRYGPQGRYWVDGHWAG